MPFFFFLSSLIVFLIGTLTPIHRSEAKTPTAQVYQGVASPISPSVQKRMVNVSWRPNCPVALEGLSYLQMSHWGLDGKIHQGEMVVAKEVADEVIAVFKDLFTHKFPINRMRLVSDYGGNDESSMQANNTSAFNCRWVTGKKNVFSKHSYGRAIDINPLINPYVSKRGVEPRSGAPYADRSQKHPGMIFRGDVCHQAFISRDWTWGGTWRSLKDYQHFEKGKKK